MTKRKGGVEEDIRDLETGDYFGEQVTRAALEQPVTCYQGTDEN